MKLREVFRYELEHRLSSTSTWVYAAVLLGLAFLIMREGGFDTNAAVHVNAPARLAFLTLILGSLFGLPVSAAIFGDAAVRDIQAEMDPLLFTSPLRKAEYLGGRFLAAVAINALVVLAIPLGLVAPLVMGYAEPSALAGPFRVGAYVQPYLLLVLPNIVFVGAVLFTTGVLTRQVVPVYLSAVAVLVISLYTMGLAGEGLPAVLSVLAPLGIHALNQLTEYWTVAEQNARLIGFPADLVWNRVVWLAVTVAVLAVLHRRFQFAHPAGGRRGGKARNASIGADAVRTRAVEVPRVAGSFGGRTMVRQTLAVARRSLADVAGSRWFVVVLVASNALTMFWGWNVGDTVFDTSTWPVTLLVAEVVLSQRVVPLILVLITVYAGELVWKEREVGVAEITDAAPVPEGAALLGRFLALVVMLVLIQAATLVGGIVLQALQGYTRFEPGLYLRVVFGLDLADYLLLAVLAMTIHVATNHKNLGHMFALIAIVFTMAASRLGIRHHLLVYGTDPGWTYSDMNGFGPFIGPFVWFHLYWAAWALLLGVVAVGLGVRGTESGMRHRLDQFRARFTRPVVRAAATAVVLILVLGGFIFYNTNILNEYRTADELGAPQAAYEKRYGRFEDIAQPTIAGVDLRVEIYADEPAVELRGSYYLVNRTGVAIDSVHVSIVRQIQARSISLDRAAKPVLVDEELGYRIFALEPALEPHDSLQLAFDVAFRPRGFPNGGNQTDVVRNGAYFNRRWLPYIGYQSGRELSDAEARRRFGLEPRPPVPAPDDAAASRHRSAQRNEDHAHLEAIVGTAADQIAVVPGVLRRSWTENGRRYFHYETEPSGLFSATVLSAEYAVLDDHWNDVELRIFHHATHVYNLGRMVRSMKASLDYFTAQFAPYAGSQLRIVEFPRYGGFGRAHPNTIAFAEDVFLSRVKEGEVDQPFYSTAHEVAHMWWPGQLRCTPVRGHRLSSESLANYSAMMVTETTYGADMARRVYDFHMRHYLRGRATQSREVPLLEATDQSYIEYRKGAIAMYTLREHIGEEAVNTALRRYLEKCRDAGPSYPALLDMYAELRAVTPDSLQPMLTDWFETVTLWDVRTEWATVEPTGAGEYVVTLDVAAKKMRADSVGNETEVPMNDRVEIGVFAPGEDGSLGEPLHLEQHRIRSGEQTIRITVPSEPARAGIDPYRKLIDRQRDDNVVEVEAAATDPGTRPESH